MLIVSDAQRQELRSAFVGWAREHDFTEHLHDASFRGVLEDVSTTLETGIRDSGLYDVVVELALETGLAPRSLHVGASPGDEPLSLALFEVFAATGVTSIRLEPKAIAFRLSPGTKPEAVDTAVEAVVAAWRTTHVAGPYR